MKAKYYLLEKIQMPGSFHYNHQHLASVLYISVSFTYQDSTSYILNPVVRTSINEIL
jgi:hypothetical protein